MNDFLVFSEEVAQAKAEKKPIVALESTIISHGMPYPENVQTAKDVERIIRDRGAVPATIAIIDGKIKIGLTDDELELLGTSHDVEKVSRRDLPYVVAMKKHGATTVAGTMICAQMAGIRVFATGGIGGVHRGAEQTMDISADLQELSRTNVAVVCAGAKSILDLGLTLEYLETHGVPVIGYQTDVLPAFYSRTSPFRVDYRLDSAEEIAQFIETKWKLGLNGGVVIANPVPKEEELEESYITAIIEQALKEAEKQHITGKAVTPFLLDRVKTLTGGKSLQANIALVKNNAALAADLARELS
ncbi:pseudouridine-5'-phosphate glycosidase [Geobacillus stearothermophilus]|uniref:pseudouridine-5'-phosphate glycosidase n=1 Tax=Geobacillus stearothermophilus TaxID=1422 RepID=UPI0005188B13|nr:pseudouridine-5'-phosphate glycosidase [Geobacillus stearothermophilus]KOR94347.1 pseudouridine-5'-phosphate glycosidase [Geobacillus stearothermophilus ATCC 12980]MED3724403.1 pseudouridine-5'-phosphate glycosidase [Geobacillus stearothermophilus]MED3732196.1 pseudouridine-5'-phosphate glycosidase [Geobacillus stearothermophilus]MED3734372.1 pseudouridine-5'-phosphate glycosidase [Geobacillus stearothermophilus]MED3739980.1 pseudouridine-5'-phosphate glycosidase [Geobacillus stearothermoph